MFNSLLNGLGLLLRPFRRLPGPERSATAATSAGGRYDWDIAGDAVTWDEGYDRLVGGRPRSTSASQDWWIGRIHPDDRDRTVLALCEALDGRGGRWATQYRILRADGACVAVRDEADVLRDAAGNAVRVRGQLTLAVPGGRGDRQDIPAALASA